MVWIASGCNPPDEWRLKYCVLLARFVTEDKTTPTSENEGKSTSKQEETDAASAQTTAQQIINQAAKTEALKLSENTAKIASNKPSSGSSQTPRFRPFLSRPARPFGLKPAKPFDLKPASTFATWGSEKRFLHPVPACFNGTFSRRPVGEVKRTQSEFTDDFLTKKPRLDLPIMPEPSLVDVDASQKAKSDMLAVLREKTPLERDWNSMSDLEQKDLINSRYKHYLVDMPKCHQLTREDIKQSILKHECISS